MADYPPPSGALMIWKAGDQLMIRIPPQAGHDRGHVINVPFEAAGVGVLKTILSEREIAAAYCMGVGHKASPTQDMATAMLRAMQAGKSATKVPSKDKDAKRRERLNRQAAINLEIDSLLEDIDLESL